MLSENPGHLLLDTLYLVKRTIENLQYPEVFFYAYYLDREAKVVVKENFDKMLNYFIVMMKDFQYVENLKEIRIEIVVKDKTKVMLRIQLPFYY